jgi:hypothetical protein
MSYSDKKRGGTFQLNNSGAGVSPRFADPKEDVSADPVRLIDKGRSETYVEIGPRKIWPEAWLRPNVEKGEH